MTTALAYDLGAGIIEHIAAMRRFARRFARTADQADDLVQDSIARALSRPHLYQPYTNLRAWLFAILRNVAISQGRKAKHRQEYARARLATAARRVEPDQLHRVALTESLRHLTALTAGEREAVALVGILDLSYPEATRHTGIVMGTLKSRLSRGRARLRALADPMQPAAPAGRR